MDCPSKPKRWVGIDPGGCGFLCVMGADGPFKWVHNAEEREFIETLAFLQDSYDVVACIEDVHSMPGQGVASSFKFGRNVGVLIGILKALKIPYHEVSPQKWQKEIWERNDKVSKGAKVDPKKTSINAAQRLYPSVDFRKTPRCHVPDDNKVDATLIATYCKANY